MTKTLLVNGYGRKQEEAADQDSLAYLHQLGYNPYGLLNALGKLAQQQSGGGSQGIFATHPGMDQCQAQLKSFLAKKQWPQTDDKKRDQRFRDFGA